MGESADASPRKQQRKMWLKEKPPNLRICRSSSRPRSNSGRNPPEEPAVEHSSRKREPSHERDPRKKPDEKSDRSGKERAEEEAKFTGQNGSKTDRKSRKSTHRGSNSSQKAKVGIALLPNRRTCLRRRYHRHRVSQEKPRFPSRLRA